MESEWEVPARVEVAVLVHVATSSEQSHRRHLLVPLSRAQKHSLFRTSREGALANCTPETPECKKCQPSSNGLWVCRMSCLDLSCWMGLWMCRWRFEFFGWSFELVRWSFELVGWNLNLTDGALNLFDGALTLLDGDLKSSDGGWSCWMEINKCFQCWQNPAQIE